MNCYRVEPTPESTVNVFSAEHRPALTIDSGDTIVVRSLDAAGYLARHEFPGAVQIVSLTPDTWGWTSSPAVPDSPAVRRLGLVGTAPAWLLWEIDAAAGAATAGDGHAVLPTGLLS